MTPLVALGEVATIVMGQSPPGETYNTAGNGLPFFQGKAEFGEQSPTPVKWCSAPARVADAGDILISVRAPVGPTNIASERCCIGRGLAAIRAKEGMASTRYLHYFLRRFEAEIAGRGVGSTFTAINRNDIERLRVPLPPLPEQHRLVRLLDEADALRRLRARAGERMAEFAPALFHLNHQQVRQIEIPLPPLPRQHEFAARVAEARALEEAQWRQGERLEALFESVLARAFAGKL